MDRSLRPATSRRHGTGVPTRPGAHRPAARPGCPASARRSAPR